MPTYEYACKQCGHRFDIRQGWSDEPLTVCPECTGLIRRVLHPAGVIFKGSGWYITDSRKPESGATRDGDDSSKTTKEPAKPKVETTTSADT